MTIVTRRRVYWMLFLGACLCFASSVFLALPIFAGGIDLSFLARSDALLEANVFGYRISSPGPAAASVILSAFYSALCLGFVLYSFRKTVSSEIFFFSFWVLSLGFEAARLFSFRLAALGVPSGFVLAAAHLVLVGRFVGILSFFAASIYAAGFRNEKLGTVALLCIIVGGGFAWILPLNTGVFDPNLLVRPGYSRLCDLLGAFAGMAAVVNFLYAARVTSEKSYRIVAMGAAALLLGQRLLLTQWNPLALLMGFALLISGSWLFVSRLHAYYLWQ